VNAGDDPDLETVEAIAEWLELCVHGHTLKPVIARRLAEQLRSGEWLGMPHVRNEKQVTLGRIDDKLQRRVPLTRLEQVVEDARQARRAKAEQAERRRFEKMIDALEQEANRGEQL
jgi:hypothetical protein